MSLIGGEMAEMPGIYAEDDFDLAGTIVGLVERNNLINGNLISEGDVIVAYSSNGLHTNGYSLARDILFRQQKLQIDSYIPDLQSTVAEAFLQIHRSYYPVLKNHLQPQIMHGMAHITGGGLPGNVKRIIPDGLKAVIDPATWKIPAIFAFLQKQGNVQISEMFRVFNMGIGFTAVVPSAYAEQLITDTGGFAIGWIEKTETGKPKVEILTS
jgi:phosphoribosylformylglycinamidine cyclo-ligase